MSRFLPAFLLSISILASWPATMAETPGMSGTAVPGNLYAMTFSRGDAALTGLLCLSDAQPDGSRQGVIVNDFGIRAIDFTVGPKGKVKITSAIPPLNRWIVKRTISADIAFCLRCLTGDIPDDRSRLALPSDSTLTVTNTRTKTSYTLTPIHEP